MNGESIDTKILGPPRRACVAVSAMDVRHMAGDADRWGRCETGGALYGLLTHHGQVVVLLATEAGPGAIRETAHFAQDAEHVSHVNRELWRRYGIQYVGTWHSHHVLGLPGPSGGDAEQSRRVATRNGLQKMVQLVLTRESDPTACPRHTQPAQRRPNRPSSPLLTKWNAGAAPGEARYGNRVPRIRVNAFIYDQAQTGVFAAARLRILNEGNVFRTALKGIDIPAFQDVGEDGPFPMENIDLDSKGTDVSREESASDALTALAEQVGRLPEEVAAGVEIVPRDSILLLSLPLSEDHRVTVRYDSGDSCPRPKAVFLAMPSIKDPIDITAGVLAARSVSLLDIYQLARTAPLGLPAHCLNRPVVQLPRQGAGSELAQPAVPSREHRRGVYETERSDHHVG